MDVSTPVNVKVLTLLNMSTLKERLEKAAKHKGVTIAEARAEIKRITGMSRSNLTHWFGGRTIEPKGAAAAQAAAYFAVDPVWFARGEGDMVPLNGKGSSVSEKQKRSKLPEDVQTLISMYEEMPDEIKPMARRHFRDLLEAFGPASKKNPFGKGKKKPPGNKNTN